MPTLLRIFFTGMLISFLGSLPLGTLNIAAMQISITEGYKEAILFSTGSLLVEMIYVRFSLIGIDWIRRQEKLFKLLEWITLFIVVALALSSFYSAMHPSAKKNIILSSTLPKFILGAAMCAVNPVQIPFWFGWSTVLFTKKILLPKNSHYNLYILGIGIGTLLGNFVFVFGGKLIVDKLNANEHVLSWVIGSIFALTALIQLYKIVKKKDAQHDMEHPEELQNKFEHRLEEFQKHNK